ncbi:MAG: hypothetical protein GXO43_03905 [Crenarchaeota archaeon]|nr:hypothetical protein [Thermoproteota archaeon]
MGFGMCKTEFFSLDLGNVDRVDNLPPASHIHPTGFLLTGLFYKLVVNGVCIGWVELSNQPKVSFYSRYETLDKYDVIEDIINVVFEETLSEFGLKCKDIECDLSYCQSSPVIIAFNPRSSLLTKREYEWLISMKSLGEFSIGNVRFVQSGQVFSLAIDDTRKGFKCFPIMCGFGYRLYGNPASSDNFSFSPEFVTKIRGVREYLFTDRIPD